MLGGKVYSAGKTPSLRPINCLLTVSDRELWIGTDRGVLRWDGAANHHRGRTSFARPPFRPRHDSRSRSEYLDRNGQWTGSRKHGGGFA